MKLFSTLIGIAMPAALATSALAGTKATEISQKFAQIEAEAREVRTDAGILKTFTHFPTLYSKQTHLNKLRQIKLNVNEMAEVVGAVHRSREAAIKFVNENPERLFHPNYEMYVEDIYDESNGVARSVEVF